MTRRLFGLNAACLSLLGLCSIAPSSAHAYAAASSLADIKITVQAIDNLSGSDPDSVVHITAGASHDDAFNSGTLSSLAGYVTVPGTDTSIGEGGQLQVQASAGAFGNQGSATALSRSSGFLSFENTSSTDTLSIDVLVEYSYAMTAEASFVGPDQYAVAELLLELASDNLGELVFEQRQLSATAPPVSMSFSFVEQLILGPSTADYWDIRSVYAQVRVAAVPLPPALALVVPGLGILVTRRRRSRSAL